MSSEVVDLLIIYDALSSTAEIKWRKQLKSHDQPKHDPNNTTNLTKYQKILIFIQSAAVLGIPISPVSINAEPVVENVQKQIMSQAKIFEAIKEASKEIFRQKNMQKHETNPEAIEGV